MNASPRIPFSHQATTTTPHEERFQWLDRYRRSGLSQEAFARTHDVKLSRLRYWLYHPRWRQSSATGAPRWQEVRVNGWPAMPSWGAEISLPGGCTVRLQTELARELVTPLLAPER
jgi:hypothetical protein